MSDSKLSKLEKLELYNWKIQYPDVELHSFPEYNCVVGIRVTGDYMAEFAVALCAETELKFRRNTGEYAVMWRFICNAVLPVYLPAGRETNLDGPAHAIAVAVGRNW